MNRRIAKTLSVLLLLTAIAVAQVPVSDVEAVAAASDFQMDGTKLVKYAGTDQDVSVPDGIKEIGEEAFAGNDQIVKVTIGGDVEAIDYRAFADCDRLRTIVVGDQVESIGTAAFSNNKELVNVTIGEGVKDFGTGVFAGCSHLESLSVSAENPYLYYSDGVLYDDEQTKVYALMPAYEKGAYTLPGTVTEITGYAFWGNPYLERVTLGSGLSEVPAYAFSNCMNLKEVEIPLTVRGIGAKAFEDCVNLIQVTLPDSMAVISDTAFDGCPNVEFIATPGTYGADFAAAFQRSEVEEVEYEDVQDSQVVDAEVITEPEEEGEAKSSEEPSPSAEPSPAPSEEPSPLPSETPVVHNKTILGESSIVSGRAVIFIDNRQPTVLAGNQEAERIDLSGTQEAAQSNTGDDQTKLAEEESLGDLLADNAQKGKGFPKYTIAGDTKIASQAFYQDSGLTAYTIDEGITEIGEFAFARSGLTSVVIPEGVTKIEYGAFYHCDSLTSVTIPDTVTEIELYAFDKTPWITNTKTGTYPYLIVGDGILLAYAGSESVVNIPDGVKQIGPAAFKDHMGITAVNLPDSVEVIGEEAFMNCRNLKTVNGGENLIRVKDRAFMNCPLSKVVIPTSMEEVGLGAYALVNGTDTVVFEGTALPRLSMEKSAMRLANSSYRTYAFGSIKNAIVPDQAGSFEGTVLEEGIYGFCGTVYTESGTQLAGDHSSGTDKVAEKGVLLQISSDTIAEGENAMATIPGNSGAYLLTITDSAEAAEQIGAAYGELYGGRTPADLLAYDMTLYDETGTVPVTKLGRQYITVQFPLPAASAANLHVVTLDQDGQLEALEYRIVNLEDGDYLQFTTSHFSPVGIYRYADINTQAQVTDGKAVITSLSGNKDDTPDTGDLIHPKWFLVTGLLAGAVALFFYKGKAKKKN